jgi:NADP-dependent 3-hydroxy acid dehydrogenase YdfG
MKKVKPVSAPHQTPITTEFLLETVQGKNIIITGGTTGIGRATAHLLAGLGANVLICGRHQQEMDDALNDYEKMNGSGTLNGVIADMAEKAGVEKLFKAADDQWKTLDVLINNAALPYESIMEGNHEDWQYLVNTNLMGYLACCHYAVERMKKRKAGHIVNIGSLSVDQREKDTSLYVATKSGVQGFTAAFRKEVNPLGIKVSLIEPGSVGTDMQPASPRTQRKKQQALEMLKAEDIAAAVLYVLSQPKRCDVIGVQIRPHLEEI